MNGRKKYSERDGENYLTLFFILYVINPVTPFISRLILSNTAVVFLYLM